MPAQHAYVTQDKLGVAELIYLLRESDVNLGVCGEGGGEHSEYYETIPINTVAQLTTNSKIFYLA